jgi:arylsulfatase A-like enzyme
MNNINKRFIIKWLRAAAIMIPGYLTLTGTEHCLAQVHSAKGRFPNIIVILADDLGYGDLGGYFGGKAKTPNLNQLAQEGMLFSDFHSNGPMCSPTRAALLTGRYPQRLGIENALPTDWQDRGIGSEENKNEITIAAYLHKAGYATGIFGKWHLGKHPSANPIRHGFDEFRGLTCGSGDYFSKMDRNGFKDWWHNESLSFQEGYATDVITDNSVSFIKMQKDKPFFLYVAYNAIHFPWQTSEDGALETVREGEDFTSTYPGTKSKLGPHKPDQIPGAVIRMIEDLDKNIGRLFASLREEGLDRNTLVFFTSDNGGYLNYNDNIWPEVGSNGPLKGQKGQLYEGGHRVPAIAWWPGHIPAQSVCNQTISTFDLLPTYLDLLGIKLPSKRSFNFLDGVSILPLLIRGKELEPRALFWRIGNQKAVRKGHWKLVMQNQDGTPELYNLSDDISEIYNLANQYPEIVSRLKEDLTDWESNVNGKDGQKKHK